MGEVKSPATLSAGMLRNPRPYLVNGNVIFVFPVGVEGFRRSGQAQLGLHHYIGDNSVDGVTVHFEEGRIELRGTFPGITAKDAMIDCINILRIPPPDPGLTLYAPGLFIHEQYVLPETWDFNHEPDDRSHSIDYTISLVRIGEGGNVKDPKGTPPPPNPQQRTTPKGKPARSITTKDSLRTFQTIAKKVYGDASKWQKLVGLNKTLVSKHKPPIPNHTLPTFRWPIGTKIHY